MGNHAAVGGWNRPSQSDFHCLQRAARMIAAELRSTSSSVVAHEQTLIRIAVSPCRTVPPHQQVPSSWTAWTTRMVTSAGPKDTST
jgi:hypothetical protein